MREHSQNSGAHEGMFRALQNRSYRLYFFGQAISLTGTWMQSLALSWLAYRLTQSQFLLGLSAFAGQIPGLIVTPLGGALADQINRHKLLIWTQVLFMIQALLLAILTLSGTIEYSHIIVLALFMGVVNAVDMPTRQAFLIEMVDNPKHLANAIALNSSVMNLARLLGPALAGAMIAWLGEGLCFLINGVSYIAVIIALAQMKIKARPLAAHRAPLLSHLREGARYAFGFAPIRALILYMASVSFFGIPFMVILPVFAKDVLGGDATTLGQLMGASGIGALVGALMLARRKKIVGLGTWIIVSSLLFAFSLMALSWTRELPLCLLVIAIGGLGMMIQLGAANTVLQTLVDEDKRGRVMGLYTMAFLGLSPFGSLLIGAVSERIGAPLTIFFSGLSSLLAALVFFSQFPKLKKVAMPVMLAKGIIEDVPLPIPLSPKGQQAGSGPLL